MGQAIQRVCSGKIFEQMPPIQKDNNTVALLTANFLSVRY